MRGARAWPDVGRPSGLDLPSLGRLGIRRPDTRLHWSVVTPRARTDAEAAPSSRADLGPGAYVTSGTKRISLTWPSDADHAPDFLYQRVLAGQRASDESR